MYNKWHETELERWLSDHGMSLLSVPHCLVFLIRMLDIPYPTPADRKDLENLVSTNWESRVQVPLANAANHASHSLDHVKDWIFDR